MKTAINKLMAEYEQKISQCDILLQNEEELRKKAWDAHDTTTVKWHYRSIAIYKAQRQAYLQAKVDIESLLDHI